MKSLNRRQALMASLPWVTRRKSPVPCDGIKWSQVPLKALYSRGGKPPEGLEKYRCSKPAYWTFRSLKKSHAQSGNYCWSHLVYNGVYGDMIEEKRTNDYLAKTKES
jgi:hypothetical protein